MARYPSEDVARFDQQFAETEADRNARLRRARIQKRIAEMDAKRGRPLTDAERLHNLCRALAKEDT